MKNIMVENWKRFLKEGFEQGEEQVKHKYYAFDWDDNLLFMPTKIIVKDINDEEVGMSTEDFAKYRSLIGKEHFDLEENGKTYIIVGFADNPFRNFREEGDEQFLTDCMSAKTAPAWPDFVECINSGSIFAIITARGHKPDTLREAVKRLVLSEKNGLSLSALIQSLNKYNRLVGLSGADSTSSESVEEELTMYLERCRMYPVSYWSASAASPEKAKVYFMKKFIKEIHKMNDTQKVDIGFSDDDPKNINLMKKELGKIFKNDIGNNEPKLTIKYTGHLPLEEK